MADHWPPTLEDLKSDSDLVGDDRSDAQLQSCLDAAQAYVRRVRNDVSYGGEGEPFTVTDDLFLGTLRLARRWDVRRQSVDGIVYAGDVSNVVPSFDSDIEKLLQVGRYAKMRFA